MILSSGYVVAGSVVQFEVLDGNIGVLALTPGRDDALIAALNAAASAHQGGILRISEATYESVKKKYPFNPSAVKRPDMLQLMRSAAAPMFKPPVVGVAESGAPAVVDKLPQPAPLPRSATAPTPTIPVADSQAPSKSPPVFRPTVSRPSQRTAAAAPTPSAPPA